ncbi:MAG: cation transporter [Ruminococcaceae bacterium]|nr:cation transporter [Oscillospiraceae bacterium]
MVVFIGKKITAKASADKARELWGTVCGCAGILLNLALCAAKLFAGVVSGSVAVTADAVNNLSDAGSSVISLAGFRLAAKKPDREHPFGHGRTEYISGLIIAFVIMLMGFELAKSSVSKIITPEAVDFTWVAVGILCASVAVKLYMFFYNRRVGKMIGSASLAATARDSLSDCISTLASLASLFVMKLWNVNLDGYVGVCVALFILWSGFSAAKDTVGPLLGNPADPELVEAIKTRVMSFEGILGVHDLVVHDYGPGRCMASLHAEVSENSDMVSVHEQIDLIEKTLSEELACGIVIHMDPIAVDDIELMDVKTAVCAIVGSWDGDFSVHDFRMVRGEKRTNIIFDVVVPFDSKLTTAEVCGALELAVKGIDPRYVAVINVDRPFH